MQAGVILGDVMTYQIREDATPEEKFEVGVNFLESLIPGRARELIDEAFAGGHSTSKVHFYRLLALVSGRSRSELSAEETARLKHAQNNPIPVTDKWSDGLRVTIMILDSAQRSDADIRVPLKELDALDPVQSSLILRNLEQFLEGPLEDQMWHRSLERAKSSQLADRRVDRVWKFFQAQPAHPRVRPPQPPVTRPVSRSIAGASAVIISASAVYLGVLLAEESQLGALAVLLVSVAVGVSGLRHDIEWRFRYAASRSASGSRSAGFASEVDREFRYYFTKYHPDDVDSSTWWILTESARQSVRDELVEVYRERDMPVVRIKWLIRHEARQAVRRWNSGTLDEYSRDLEPFLHMGTIAVLGAGLSGSGLLWAVVAAVQARPLGAVCATLLLLGAGLVWARYRLDSTRSSRLFAAEQDENRAVLAVRRAEFDRWRKVLADRPSDREIATWLDCDRKIIFDRALRHYRLKPSDVISHAFAELPAGRPGRARVRHGPWRYRGYRISVFLLTMDGVRQFDAVLDLDTGEISDRERMNYRFDVIASVRVTRAASAAQTFALVLVNGQEIKMNTAESALGEVLEDETPEAVARITQDAAGLQHTLSVLEGVAAEGKEWVRRRGAPVLRTFGFHALTCPFRDHGGLVGSTPRRLST
ncbi:hypothetical protein BBK14_28005, partial [Parafrankia soli]